MNKNIILIFTFLITFAFCSCEKTPGEGGNARIRGKIWVKQYDPFFTILQQEYYGKDVNVELTFGDNVSPDQTVKTNSTGDFEFQYLRKGKYKVTLYSQVFRDTINPSGLVTIDKTITINGRKEILDIGTFIIQR